GRSFAAIAAYGVSEDGSVLGRGPEARRINRGQATASLFPLLGGTPRLGRFYTERDDDTASPQPGAVIGYGLWQRDSAAEATSSAGHSRSTTGPIQSSASRRLASRVRT